MSISVIYKGEHVLFQFKETVLVNQTSTSFLHDMMNDPILRRNNVMLSIFHELIRGEIFLRYTFTVSLDTFQNSCL